MKWNEIKYSLTFIKYIGAIVAFISLSGICNQAWAANDDYGLCRLSVRDGLAGSIVTSILTDHNGIIWMGTNNGVCKYTGKTVLTFHLGDDGRHNHVHNLYEGPDHRIYAASGKGVFRKSVSDDDFHRFAPEIKTCECMLPCGDTVFIGNNDGFHIWNGSIVKTIRPAVTLGYTDNSIRDIRRGTDGNVWFVSMYSLHKYNVKTGAMNTYDLSRKLPVGSTLSALAFSKGKCYLGTKNNGLFCYNVKSGILQPVSGIGHIVHALQTDADGNVCVASDGAGAYIVDVRSNAVLQHFGTNEQGRNNLPTNAVYSFHRDRKGNNWMGFFRYGLQYNYNVTPLFQRNESLMIPFLDQNVRCICTHGQYCLLGTSSGFLLHNTQSGHNKFFDSGRLGGGHQVLALVWYKGCFYIGVRDGGLWRFDPQSERIEPIVKKNGCQLSAVVSLAVSPYDELYIGTMQGLFVMDAGGVLTEYNADNSQLGTGIVMQVTFDKRGNAWLGTSRGMVFRHGRSGKFIHDSFPEGFFDRETHLIGSVGHNGLLFFFNDNGVYYTNVGMTRFGKINLPRFLHNQVISGFVDDLHGHYWLASDLGLFRVNYDGMNLQHFGEGEGLNCQFINRGGVSMSADGILTVITSNGIFSADTKEMEKWQQKVDSKVFLYDISEDGKSLDNPQVALANESHKLAVGWNLMSGVLRLKFLLADYSHHENRLYKYKIDGDKYWTTVADGETVAISNLTLGQHKIVVQLAGFDGTQQEFLIKVYPTPLFFFEVLVLLIAVLVICFAWRYRRSAQQLLGEREMMEETIIEMDHQLSDDKTLSPSKLMHIRDDECERIVHDMRLYLEKQKVYQQPELKMSDLAEALHVSPNKLSQVFNNYLNVNYYEYINDYRLAEFKRRVKAGDHKRFTILALSEQCGFRKSSFFATFRRVEGMTPTEYIKKLQ